MRYFSSFFLLILLLVSTNCNTTGNSEEDAETLAAKAKLIEADAGFSVDLFKAIHANDTSSNIFISSLSISMALGMTMNGATGNTLFEMQNTLGFADMTQEEINKGYRSLKRQLEGADDDIEFDIANSVWAYDGYSVKEEFLNVVQQYFDAETASMDFSDPKTVDVINDWVSDNTNERITKIIDAISQDDRMFLINAVYFDDSWKNKFDPEETNDYNFYIGDNETVVIDMMSQLNEASYLINDDVNMLELPYGEEAFSMLFIKPGKREVGVDELISTKFSSEVLDAWVSNLVTAEVNYFIPKLEIEYKRQLKNDLVNLGMEQVFRPDAELYNLYEGVNNLFVTSVLHKTFLKMDEEGTEAAGVTAVTVGVTSGPPPPPTLIFDEPYLIILREKSTGAILFIGKIGDPTAAE